MHEYFPVATPVCPTFDANSEWHPLIDGAAYFAELDALLAGLGAGDEILLAGLELDPDLDLTGLRPGQPGHRGLSDRLLAAGAAGVDVRLLLAGKVTASFLPFPGLAGFRHNAAACRDLNTSRPAGWPADQPPPLAGHALVDYSGELLGSNHQKSVVVTRAGVLTAFVGGIDLVEHRHDRVPHDTQTLKGQRWGWHDAAVRLRGPAAAQAHLAFLERWHEAATLPERPYFRLRRPWPRINPPAAPAPARAAEQKPIEADDTSVRVLRSVSTRKLDSLFPWRRYAWADVPHSGIQEIFETLTTAICAARRYIYFEDQYLYEYAPGQRRPFELYPYLRDAAARGVKVILVGSGTRDPDDPGVNLRPINSSVNRDVRTKILDQLDAARRRNVAVYRIEHVTVHSKIVLIDDAFANIGSANIFSRSMSGVDCEISAAVETRTSLVRDLRVQLWGEHLRAPLTDDVTTALGDLDVALGIWDPDWLPADRPPTTWRTNNQPRGFEPTESVLSRVDDPAS